MESTEIYWLYPSRSVDFVELGVDSKDIFLDLTETGLAQATLTLSQAHSLIPKDTIYCYGWTQKNVKVCPFWERIKEFPNQSDGYCHFMKLGDVTNSSSMLWDMCKECGVSQDFDLH